MSGAEPGDLDLVLGPAPAPTRGLRRFLRSSFLQIGLYYLVLLAVSSALIQQFPIVRRSLVMPAIPALAEGAAILTGGVAGGGISSPAMLAPTSERALTTFLVVCAAIAVAVPVAWVYMLTKRHRFDPGLVRSVVILPIAVAGILLVVKNSLAIAFSLAGIVAAVRFRNTLKDPRDAVYIFLTIAIGIASGVQALDVALVVSFVFNVTVFTLWRFRIGSPEGGRYGRTGVLSIGDPGLLVARNPSACDAVRGRLIEAADGLDLDGVLLVHTTEPDIVRNAVLEALRQSADDWRALEPVARGGGLTTAQYLVEFDKKSDGADLLGMLAEWSSRIAAAEYIPFHRRRRRRSDPDDDDDGDDD